MSCVSICFIAPDFIACSRRSDSGAPMKNRAWKKNANIAPQLCLADLFLHSRVFRGRKRAYHANISGANDFVNLKIHRPILPTGTGRQTCLPRSYTKGDHDFPDVPIMASPFYPVAYPFLPGKMTSTRTGNLPVPVHRNGVS